MFYIFLSLAYECFDDEWTYHFAKVAAKKLETLLNYEHFRNALHRLNPDSQSTPLPLPSHIKEVSNRWIKSFFVSRTTTKKVNILPNVQCKN